MILVLIFIFGSILPLNFAMAEEDSLDQVIPIRIYIKKKEKRKKPKIVKPEKWLEKYNLFAFYTLSEGTFSEKIKSTGTTLKSTQNSPLTLGVGITLYPHKKPYFYSYSIYISKLRSASSSLGGETDVPLEVGVNGYYNRPIKDWWAIPYGGIDYERISTFNTDEVILGKSLKTRQHNIYYLTAGFSKGFTIDKTVFLFKVSASKSVISNATEPSLFSEEEFTGYKYIFYLNFKVFKNVLYHLIYKQHFLDGPTELEIKRFGIGVGYSF